MLADELTEQMELAQVMGRVRKLVQELLDQRAQAPDVSFALAFIATELGLGLAPDPKNVFSVVLSGVLRAASETTAADDPDAADAEEEQSIPGDAIVH